MKFAFIGGAVLPTLLVAFLLGTGGNSYWGIEQARLAADQTASVHVGWTDCMTLATTGGESTVRPDRCTFNETGANAHVYLVGDSNAAQWSEAALKAARTGDCR